jgi:hypothetical protein
MAPAPSGPNEQDLSCQEERHMEAVLTLREGHVKKCHAEDKEMYDLVKRAVEEDVALHKPSRSLWRVSRSEPEIRQIYGHFLPPYHRLLVKSLVAKDFNFPAAYHAAVNLSRLKQLYRIGERLDPETTIAVNHGIRVRIEEHGAIVYTPYFNGFYMNREAVEIWNCLEDGMSILSTATKLGLPLKTVTALITRMLMLGLVDVR